MLFGDTIAAIATAQGRGGIAIVRVSGPDAFSIAERISGVRPIPGRFSFSRFRSGAKSLDEGVLLAFKSPCSYTGEDVVEFQCHGGSVVSRRVLEECFAQGARLAHRGEFTERAFLNGKLDYDQASSIIDLIDAKTDRAADAALEGLSGGKRRTWRALYQSMLEISSEFEHCLDIDENELPAGFVSSMNSRVHDLSLRIDAEISKVRAGRILRDGVLVVLVGPPNVGKSSLMNALLEENRAIVSDIPGTTRDSIEAWLDLDGWPVRLVDTAGLRETSDAIEAEGVARSRKLIADADIVLLLSENGESQLEGAADDRTIRLSAKCDLHRGNGFCVSSTTGEGIAELRKLLIGRISSLEPKTAAEDVEPLISVRSLLPTDCAEIVLAANAMRLAATCLGEAIGTEYSSDLLKNLFSRFCVGK